MAGLAYKVEDRSLLLPLYKKVLIEPVVPWIPARVHPNAITHAGHLFNVLSLAAILWGRGAPDARWPYAAAAIGIQLYNFCDNVDGAHARRTGQTSATGELLDHGLDMLSIAYVAVITAASVGSSPAWTVAVAIILPTAAGMTCWEQAETGVFRLGLVNQIEAITMLSAVLAITAMGGVDVWTRFAIYGVTLKLALLVFVCTQTIVGVVRGVVRVASQAGAGRLVPASPLFAALAAVGAAFATGGASMLASVVIALAVNVFFGLTMLATRTADRRPRFPYPLALTAIAVFALVAWRLDDRPVGSGADFALTAAIALALGAIAGGQTRAGFRRVARLDRAAPPAMLKA